MLNLRSGPKRRKKREFSKSKKRNVKLVKRLPRKLSRMRNVPSRISSWNKRK